MQLTITLNDEEVDALKRMIARHRLFETKECTLEDAIHECIRSSLYEEAEPEAAQEGM
jgi:hypothetical protein